MRLLSEVVKIGDYVEYCGKNSQLLRMQVFKNDKKSGLQISGVVGKMALSGTKDYANGVELLNNFCDECVNKNFAIAARSIGCSEESVKSLDSTLLDVYDQGFKTMMSCYNDDEYVSDVEWIKEHGLETTEWTWLASRFAKKNLSDVYFGLRYLTNTGNVNRLNLTCRYYSEDAEYSAEYHVRAVILMKPGIHVSFGDGTMMLPYRLVV